MLLPDVNVLLYALRSDSPHHERAKTWLDQVHTRAEPIALCSPVLSGLIRLATNPRIFFTPTPRSILWKWIDVLIGTPHHRFVGAGPRHPELVRQLCTEGDAAGNLVSDAVIGAIAIEHGSRVISTDGDFARFPSVRWRRPWPVED